VCVDAGVRVQYRPSRAVGIARWGTMGRGPQALCDYRRLRGGVESLLLRRLSFLRGQVESLLLRRLSFLRGQDGRKRSAMQPAPTPATAPATAPPRRTAPSSGRPSKARRACRTSVTAAVGLGLPGGPGDCVCRWGICQGYGCVSGWGRELWKVGPRPLIGNVRL
jgi:hypothetical protein